MTLPPKLKRAKSGITKAPKREWPRHRSFVRKHACSVPGCMQGPIEFAHVRSAANSGTGIKPFDWFGISLCSECHREQHNIGVETFQCRHGIDLFKLAAEFARLSPDTKMKEAIKELS